MNTRRTLRKAIAGLLKQSVSNAPAVPASSDRNLNDISNRNIQDQDQPKNS